jgi:V8-like Glu-specific endopeptidase
MKKILALIILNSSFSFAVDTTNVNTTTAPLNCNIRLSNVKIERQINIQAQQGFCTGSLIDAETVVTAAHCLNEAIGSRIDDLKKIPNDVILNIAVKEEQGSHAYELKSGETVAVYSNELAKHSQRQELVSKNLIEKVQHDLVILKLKQPIANFDSSACPRLPTQLECNEFTNNFLNNPNKQTSQIVGTYYISNEYAIGDRLKRAVFPYPSTRMVDLTSTSFVKHSTHSHFLVSFENSSLKQKVKFKKGDSGAGLLWDYNGRKIIIGVQSAASISKTSIAHFANVCNYAQHPNWPR